MKTGLHGKMVLFTRFMPTYMQRERRLSLLRLEPIEVSGLGNEKRRGLRWTPLLFFQPILAGISTRSRGISQESHLVRA